MGGTVHLDGRLVDADDAPLARSGGLHRAEAAAVTLRAVAGRPLRWNAHRSRLDAAADALSIPVPADLRTRVGTTLSANGLDGDDGDALVDVVVAGGGPTDSGAAAGGTGRTDPAATEPTVVVVAEDRPAVGPATLQTVKAPPAPDDVPPASPAAAWYAARARTELVADADEALLVDGGIVVGVARSDLWLVGEEGLVVPDSTRPDGVLHDPVRTLAEEEGVPVERARFAPDAVRDASEAFLTVPGWGVRPVVAADGIDVGEGPLTALLRERFERWAREQ